MTATAPLVVPEVRMLATEEPWVVAPRLGRGLSVDEDLKPVVLNEFDGVFIPLSTANAVAWPFGEQEDDSVLIDELTAGLFPPPPPSPRILPRRPNLDLPAAKKARLVVPSIPEVVPGNAVEPEPVPPGGPAALSNVFKLVDPATALRRRGGLTAREYRRSVAIPLYKKKRNTRDWTKAKAAMYKSRTAAASSRRRVGGKFTSAPSGWKSAEDIRKEREAAGAD